MNPLATFWRQSAIFALDWRRKHRPVNLELRHRSLKCPAASTSKTITVEVSREWPKSDAVQHRGAIHSEQCPTPRGHSQLGPFDAH